MPPLKGSNYYHLNMFLSFSFYFSRCHLRCISSHLLTRGVEVLQILRCAHNPIFQVLRMKRAHHVLHSQPFVDV